MRFPTFKTRRVDELQVPLEYDESWLVSGPKDRRQRILGIVRALADDVQAKHIRTQKVRILDIGGKCYANELKDDSIIDYRMIDLHKKMSKTRGGYNVHPEGETYDGRNLPYSENTVDIAIMGFMLHHASQDSIFILEQVRRIAKRYVIVTEDLSEVDYPDQWHERNFNHQVGGMFRSNEEWRRLFRLIGFSLKQSIAIRRSDDLDGDKVFRALYVLET